MFSNFDEMCHKFIVFELKKLLSFFQSYFFLFFQLTKSLDEINSLYEYVNFIFIHYTKVFYCRFLFFPDLMIMNFKFLLLLFKDFYQKIENYFKSSTFLKIKMLFDLKD